MDAKITKKRLSSMLSYDWIKIIAIVVAICFVWTLVFTMTATPITVTQKFYVYNYLGNRSFASENSRFNDLYKSAFENGVFSYEVLETAQEDLGKEYGTILEARFSVGEGDLMFVAHAKNEDDSYKDETTQETAYYKYTETFARSRRYYMYELEGENSYFAQLEAYLSKYFFSTTANGVVSDWENGDLNEEIARKDFRKRVKKDKRFKTKAQLLQGEKDDCKRLNDYRDALVEFYGYLDRGLVRFEKVAITDSQNQTTEHSYYVNLNPAIEQIDPATGEAIKDEFGNIVYKETVMDGLQDYLAHYEDKIINAEGKTTKKVTSKNMCVAFLSMAPLEKKYRVEEGFQCESLLFVNYLIEAVLNKA